MVFAVMRYFQAQGCLRALLAATIPLSGVAILGSLPFLISLNPARCAEIHLTDNFLTCSVAPFQFGLAAGSLIGFVVACMRLTTARWYSLDALAKCAILYFVFSMVCNLVGFIGGVFAACPPAVVEGESSKQSRGLLMFWIAGSVGTNLILHKTLLLRGRSFMNPRVAELVTRAFSAEVLSVILSIPIAVVGLVAASNSVRNQMLWAVLSILQAFCVLILFFADLVLSIIVMRALLMATRSVHVRAMPPSRPDILSHALSVTKFNAITIAVSVSTTSVVYIIAIVVMLHEAMDSRSSVLNGALLFAWCTDSLSNDICAISTGFGSVSNSLHVLASAGKADVIGAPFPHTSESVEQIQNPVIGHVIAPTCDSARIGANTSEDAKMSL
jgi:hypothetical protein